MNTDPRRRRTDFERDLSAVVVVVALIVVLFIAVAGVMFATTV